jgi:putative phage-type endonuclease
MSSTARAHTQQDRSAWIGGSDIAAVCGISPFRSALDVWLEKTGKPIDEERTAAEEERLYFGKIIEPVILQALQERHGYHIVNRNQRYIHNKHDWMRAEIDAETLSGAFADIVNVECKNVNAFARKGWGEEGTDEAPDYYVAQAMWGQEITDRSMTIAAAFFGGSSLKLFPIKRDNDVVDWLMTEGEKFWTRNVQGDIPPDPRTKEDAARMLAKMPGFRWTPSQETLFDIADLRGIKKEIAERKKKADEIESRIVCSFAAAELVHPENEGKYVMVDESGKSMASWNRQTRKGFTVAESSFHVLRLTGEK